MLVKRLSTANQIQLRELRQLTARIGQDALLTQGSSGNSSAKLDGTLWIKASGKWMADAVRNEIFLPLDLSEVNEFLHRGLDPTESFPAVSLETAMHAVVPHPMVLHVHSVDTIAWAVRQDAAIQLAARLGDLRWQWIPYTPSGLPLAREMERALTASSGTQVFVLGNHGLVIGANDCTKLEALLTEVLRRLSISPRQTHPADYSVLAEICADSSWSLPDDDDVHALATDALSQAILSGGVLYPCQEIFSGFDTSTPFRPIRNPDQKEARYSNRPFLLIEKYGVVVNRSIRPAELAMLSGLAQVVQRLSASAPIRYLTDEEVNRVSGHIAYRYRDLANERISAYG